MAGKFWTQSWSPIVGCKPCSPGCARCWAKTMVMRMQGAAASRGAAASMRGLNGGDPLLADLSAVLDEDEFGKPTDWNGEHSMIEKWLDRPLTWRKPRVAAAGWLGDMWRDDVTDRQLGRVIELACAASSTVANQFLMLTKHPDRMRRFIDIYSRPGGPMPPMHMLDGLWWGATVCDQHEADEKIPQLLNIPGKRWLCIEPLLGDLDLAGHPAGYGWNDPIARNFLKRLSWVVIGQETGPGSRSAREKWFRKIIDQCFQAGVPVWTKSVPENVHPIRQAPAPIAAILKTDKSIVAECRRAGAEIEAIG